MEPACPVFGICGGCAYQDRDYERELVIKENALRELFQPFLDFSLAVFEPMIPSPDLYRYRTKIDLTYRKLPSGERIIGFLDISGKRMVPIQDCFISRTEIAESLPKIYEQTGLEKFSNYRLANLAIKTDASNRVVWGGMGRGSLALKPEDYLFAEIQGKKIFYSLDTFFQVNHSILPRLMETLERLAGFDSETHFYDLYGGVGLFSVYFADKVKKAVLVEEHPASIVLAEYNKTYHRIQNLEIIPRKVEEAFSTSLRAPQGRSNLGLKADCFVVPPTDGTPRNDAKKNVAIVDPPRKGLSPTALKILTAAKYFSKFFYLSCNPETLVRDLRAFIQQGWQIEKVVPFDFFPRTKHLETLVMLKPNGARPPQFGGLAPTGLSAPLGFPLEIEIGCGKGKFLIARAEAHPKINFLGIDRVAKWMNIGAKRGEKRNLSNLRFMKIPVQELLPELPEASVSVFHLYFPDPWPKRRHRRRRLVNAKLLRELHAYLVPQGFIEIATDDGDYFSCIKKSVQETRGLWETVRESRNERLIEEEAATNYELKFRAAGKDVYYLELRKTFQCHSRMVLGGNLQIQNGSPLKIMRG